MESLCSSRAKTALSVDHFTKLACIFVAPFGFLVFLQFLFLFHLFLVSCIAFCLSWFFQFFFVFLFLCQCLSGRGQEKKH